VRAVTLAQVQAFHRRFYSAAYGEFAASATSTRRGAPGAGRGAFGGWKQPAAGALPYPRAAAAGALAPTRFIEVTPDKGQRQPARPACRCR
jgi:zinc protease